MLQPCVTCRREFNLELAYGSEATTHPDKKGYVCPACWKERENREYYRHLWTYGIVGLFALLVLVFNRDMEFSWFCLNFCILFVFGLLSTIPHELGHAIAGKLVGVRIFQIGIGTGKTIWDRRILGCRYRIGAIPFGGYVFGIPYGIGQYRSKMLFFTLAGPLTNLLLAWKAFSFLPADNFAWVSDTRLWPIAGFIFVSNVWAFFYTIYPRNVDTEMGMAGSDGLQIYDLLVKPLPDLSHERMFFCLYAAEFCLESGEEKEALSWTNKGLDEYPDDMQLLNYKAAALICLESFGEARGIYKRLLRTPELPVQLRYWVMALSAYNNIFLKRPRLLKEADIYSAEAFRNQPWELPIEMVRGIVLNEMGRYEEGIPMLARTLKETRLKSKKGFCAYFLALAEFRRGEKKAAQDYLQMARRLDPKSKLLKRVEAELAGGRFMAGSQTPV